MRTVSITIESSEGPIMGIRKRVIDAAVEVSIWRGSGTPTVSIFPTHSEGLEEMAKAAGEFVREVG